MDGLYPYSRTEYTEKQHLWFGLVKFEISVRHPSGELQWQFDVSLELRGEVRVGVLR